MTLSAEIYRLRAEVILTLQAVHSLWGLECSISQTLISELDTLSNQPGFGEMRLKGELKVTDHLSINDPQDSALLMSLPDIHRLGIQYGDLKLGDKAFADYVRWSVFDHQCLLSDPDGTCEDNVTLNINKSWHDAFGLRLGGSYWLNEAELYLGGGYDANAAPDPGVDPSLFDMDKVSRSRRETRLC